jgi:hypothetical protein
MYAPPHFHQSILVLWGDCALGMSGMVQTYNSLDAFTINA